MQKIVPFLWFNNNAEEAVNYYVSIFKDAKISKTIRYSKSSANVSGMPRDSVMTVAFQLAGQEFVALNGGPIFKFTEAVSFVVNCETQEELDYYWSRLSEGGDEKAQQCGWLKDKYGVSWQVVPATLNSMLQSADKKKAERVTHAIMHMKKLDIAVLRSAYDSD